MRKSTRVKATFPVDGIAYGKVYRIECIVSLNGHPILLYIWGGLKKGNFDLDQLEWCGLLRGGQHKT